MQLRRNVLIAVAIVLFIYFEIHSCSKDSVTAPQPPVSKAQSIICDANDVYFLNSRVGWVVGSYGTLIKTEDGGNTWKGQRIDDSRLTGVDFVDSYEGWAIGKDGAFYHTLDGGESWNQVVSQWLPSDEDFSKIVFMSDSIGFALGYKGVYRTMDRGSSWMNYWLPVVPYRGAWGMSFVDRNTGYLLGCRWLDSDSIIIYKTTDSAKNWAGVNGSRSSILRTIVTIHFVDENVGWAGGGVVMKTIDGGMHWTTQVDPASVRDFFFWNEQKGFAVGGQRILYTEDGGNNWVDVAPQDDRIVDLRSVYFIDENVGWITGHGKEEMIDGKTYKHSLVLKSSDGGQTWDLKDFLFDPSLVSSSESE